MKNNYLEKVISDLKKEKELKINQEDFKMSFYSNLEEILTYKKEEKNRSKSLNMHFFNILMYIITLFVYFNEINNIPKYYLILFIIQSICFIFSIEQILLMIHKEFCIKKQTEGIKCILKLYRNIKKENNQLNQTLPSIISKKIKNKREENLENSIFSILKTLKDSIHKSNFTLLDKEFNLSNLISIKETQSSNYNQPQQQNPSNSIDQNETEENLNFKLPSLFDLSARSIKNSIRKKVIKKTNALKF